MLFRRFAYFLVCLAASRCFACAAPSAPGSVRYAPADSSEIVRLLQEARTLPPATSRPLFFARRFLGRPYVAHTLDTGTHERLTVNLSGFDCTTLVETVAALTLADRDGRCDFDSFLSHLRRLRYKGGRTAYAARQHYFSWWIGDNAARGMVREITAPAFFTGRRTLSLNYMSRHPQQYAALNRNPSLTDSIRRREQAWEGRAVRYLPSSRLKADAGLRGIVRDGDIVATVTRRAGLDIAHVGFAVWGRDGHLHLLNASSLRGKVVEERWTLHEYLLRQKTIVGLRIVRLNP